MPTRNKLHQRLGSDARVGDELAVTLVKEIAEHPPHRHSALVQELLHQYRDHLEARQWYWREIDLHLLNLETNLFSLLRRHKWRTWKGNSLM